MTTPTPDDDGAARSPGPLAAVVLSGGRGSRLGGVSKAALEVGGVPLLDGVLDALAAGGVARVVVVGEPPVRGDRPGVAVVREDPPFGGPLAAVGAGLAALARSAGSAVPAEVLLLACDLPRAAELVPLLLGPDLDPAAGLPADGAVVTDADGRNQWLAARYDLAALTTACRDAAATTSDGTLTGLPLRAALGLLRLREVTDPSGASIDVDTPEDLERARGSTP